MTGAKCWRKLALIILMRCLPMCQKTSCSRNCRTCLWQAGEIEVERRLSQMAARNLSAGQSKGFFVGAGAYRHHVPASVDHLIQRSEFLTAYTPYQPEISQGTLQVLFEFQTQVAMLTGMEVANASMYDGSTATAEAVLMARRVTRRNRAILSAGLHPHYRAVVENMDHFSGGDLVLSDTGIGEQEDLASQIDEKTACVVVQYPDFFGNLHDFTDLAKAAHDNKALLIVVVTEVVSLGAIKSPGEMDADIVIAEGNLWVADWILAGRMWVCLRRVKNIFARCPEGFAGKPLMRMRNGDLCSPCQRVNSISGAKKRRQTSVPIRG